MGICVHTANLTDAVKSHTTPVYLLHMCKCLKIVLKKYGKLKIKHICFIPLETSIFMLGALKLNEYCNMICLVSTIMYLDRLTNTTNMHRQNLRIFHDKLARVHQLNCCIASFLFSHYYHFLMSKILKLHQIF